MPLVVVLRYIAGGVAAPLLRWPLHTNIMSFIMIMISHGTAFKFQDMKPEILCLRGQVQVEVRVVVAVTWCRRHGHGSSYQPECHVGRRFKLVIWKGDTFY